MIRVLFVDDNERALERLEKSLQSCINQWDMVFTTNPFEALTILENGPGFDLVVSDLHMPEMSGEELLSRIMTLYPQTGRFILSEQTQAQRLFKTSAMAHQFLSKPCDPVHLIAMINRACTLRRQLASASLNRKLLEIGGIPSIPKIYQQILEAMRSEEVAIADIAKLIQQDAGLSTKVLQLVNSPFIALRHHISDITHATTLLGMNQIRNLVLMVEIFEPENRGELSKYINLDALWNHCLTVAEYAKKITEDMTSNTVAISDAYTAGLLHEIGQIVLASKLPNEYIAAHKHAMENGISLNESEKAIFGSTHCHIGGYLLELWGLPDTVTEAIVYHDYPSAAPESLYDIEESRRGLDVDDEERPFDALTSLHAASYIISDATSEEASLNSVNFDAYYMEQLGLVDKIEKWWELCIQ